MKMIPILALFLTAFVLSLVITPPVRRLGFRWGALDRPDERKVHARPIPRNGGMAIFASLALTVVLGSILRHSTREVLLRPENLYLFSGGILCFGIGLWDDFKRLSYRLKFLVQIFGATVAYAGGIQVNFLFQDFAGSGFLFPIVLSYAVTVFWFLLFINAVNLIDGLDGLAAGICIFACIVLVLFSMMKGVYLVSLMSAALAGSILGFLRYNFNPARIFLGDGGSYFLGYMIAGLSITGSLKTGLVAAILIPLLAMGVPVFDTILSPVRRFVVGKNPFKPDKGHIHHQLIQKGFGAKNVVIIIYGVSVLLCAVSILLINVRDVRIGLFLIILLALTVVFTRKLGYFEYVAADKFYGWLKDLQDVTGMSRARRTFLGLQVDIGESKSFDELWENVCRALEGMQFVRAELTLGARGIEKGRHPAAKLNFERRVRRRIDHSLHMEEVTQNKIEADKGMAWRWVRGHYKRQEDIEKRSLLKIDLPLFDHENRCIGSFMIMKDIRVEPITPYTLRRVEQLRRSMATVIERLAAAEKTKNEDIQKKAEI